MKTILVLTDFSENASQATSAALLLSKKLHTNILLFNSYSKYPVVATYAGGPWVVDQFLVKRTHSQTHLDLLTEDLEYASEQLYPDERMPKITSFSAEGDLGSNVSEIIMQKDVELIVMGARAENTDDHFLFGSDTTSVIQNSTRPIFVIPSGCDLKELKKVVFATDYCTEDIAAIKYLVKIRQSLNFQLDIIHISVSGEPEADANVEIAFLKQLMGLNHTGITYHKIRGNNVSKRLNHFCKETGAGILSMVHKQGSLIVRLLRESMTKNALVNQKIPLFIFPSKNT